MKQIKYSLALLLALLSFICSAATPAFAVGAEALQVAFINRFIRSAFVSWPSPYDIESNKAANVCTIGKSDAMNVIGVLDQPTEAIRITVKEVSTVPTAPGDCHVLFIGALPAGSAEAIIHELTNTPTLTVSDSEGFIDKGGMIGFVVENKKLRMHINKGAADIAGIKLDTDLLGIAKRVKR